MASKYDGATIEVVNWEKYNPRTTGKRYSWFRLDNELAQGPTLFGLNCEHKWLWITILCHFSKRKCEPFLWNCAFFTSITGVGEKTQEQALAFFNKNGLISIKLARVRTNTQSVDAVQAQTCALRDETRHNETRRDETPQDTNDAQARADFDFESVYKRFPRKEGKSPGLKKLRSQVKTAEDFGRLVLAVENYSASRRNQDPQFTKYFSTFVSEWRDWIDYKPEEHPSHPPPSSPAFRRMQGNQEALNIVLKTLEESENGKAS